MPWSPKAWSAAANVSASSCAPDTATRRSCGVMSSCPGVWKDRIHERARCCGSVARDGIRLRLFSRFPCPALPQYHAFAYTVICTSSSAVIAPNEDDDPNPEEFNGTSTIRRSGGSNHCACDRNARPRRDRAAMVACHDRRQQRRRQQARGRFQRQPVGLQGHPVLQGRLCRHHERRHRRVPRRQRAAHHAGVRGRHRDHDERHRRHQAGLSADEGCRRTVRPQGLPSDDHGLLLDLQGRHAVVSLQLVLDGDVDQQGRAEEGRHRNTEDLAGSLRRRQEAEGGGSSRPAASPTPGRPGPISSSSRPGTTCRSAPRRTGSTVSTPS